MVIWAHMHYPQNLNNDKSFLQSLNFYLESMTLDTLDIIAEIFWLVHV